MCCVFGGSRLAVSFRALWAFWFPGNPSPGVGSFFVDLKSVGETSRWSVGENAPLYIIFSTFQPVVLEP